MNDLRPIALTSCVMKVFERCVLFYLNKKVLDCIDSYQFAYKSQRGVEDAITHVLYKYLYSFRLPSGNYKVVVFLTSQLLLILFSLIFHVINF